MKIVKCSICGRIDFIEADTDEVISSNEKFICEDCLADETWHLQHDWQVKIEVVVAS